MRNSARLSCYSRTVMIELSAYEEEIIARNLPPHLAALKSKYPNTVYNAASSHILELLPLGFEPEIINIYYGEEDNPNYLPNLSFRRGKLELIYLTENCKNSPVIQIEFDNDWVYIEIERQILLDRVRNIELPRIEVLTEAEILAITEKSIGLI